MGDPVPQQVEILFAHARIDHDASQEALDTNTWVRKFRNNIMHAKAETSGAVTHDENGHAAIDPA